MQKQSFRSGVVTLIGRPSSGKSSIVNALCGHRVSIVTPVPQTTRNAIRGIIHEPDGQAILVDTPGYHREAKPINVHMRDLIRSSIGDGDAVLYIVDATRPVGAEEEEIASLIAEIDHPLVLVRSKRDRPSVFDVDTFVEERGINPAKFVDTRDLDRSNAGNESGIGALRRAIIDVLPEGPPYYPEEFYTDQEPAFRIAEIVRERAMLRARRELPHSIYVSVADLEDRGDFLAARVFLYVERESQKGILVGARGSVVTAIRTESQRLLNEIFPKPVRLSLQIKVDPRWRRNETLLTKLIR